MKDKDAFVERSEHQPSYEILDFDKLRNQQPEFMTHILLGYIPKDKMNAIIEDPDWDSSKMRIQIMLNGTQITNTEFNAIINEFSNRMLHDRIHLGKWDDFEEAVKVKAKQLLKDSMGDFAEKIMALQDNVGHLADESEKLVQAAWNAPYFGFMNSEMHEAGEEAIAKFGEYNDSLTNRRVLAKLVFDAMAKKRPNHPNENLKLQLPDEGDNSQAISEQTGATPEQVEAIRKQAFDEVRKMLERNQVAVQ